MTLINYSKVFDDLAHEISETAESKGFWNMDGVGDVGAIPTKLALIHTEISEALEVHRTFYDDEVASEYTGMTPMQEEAFSEEMADAMIRILDVIGFYGLEDFGEILIAKMDANRERPHLHGKRY